MYGFQFLFLDTRSTHSRFQSLNIRRSTDLEALKLWKGLSGHTQFGFQYVGKEADVSAIWYLKKSVSALTTPPRYNLFLWRKKKREISRQKAARV